MYGQEMRLGRLVTSHLSHTSLISPSLLAADVIRCGFRIGRDALGCSGAVKMKKANIYYGMAESNDDLIFDDQVS